MAKAVSIRALVRGRRENRAVNGDVERFDPRPRERATVAGRRAERQKSFRSAPS